MGEFVGGRIVPKHCGAWNKNSKYEMLSIVYQPETGDSYISRKSVPAGTALNSEEYWAICSEYSAQVCKLEQDVDADVEQMHTDLTRTKADMSREFSETHTAISKELTDTHTVISQELTETESRMQESLQLTTETLSGKVEQAQTDLNTGRKELNDAKTTLNKRMDSIAGGMTTDSEILDARVDNQGTTHASLGEAMRSAEKTHGLWDDWLTTIVSQLLDEATGRETRELTFDSTIRTFINLNGTVGTLANESDSHWHTSEMIPVVAGHVYIITASSGWKKYYYAFYDSDENVLAGEIAPDNKSGKIENRIVIAPVGAISMRITWIQVSNFMGKVEEVTRFLFPTNELNEKPESRMVAVETGLEKAKADLIAAATGEQNTLLSAAVVEGEAVEFTYTANRCINEKAGEVVPLSSENTAFRVSYVELLLNSVNRCIAVRPCDQNNPNAIHWGRLREGRWCALSKSCRGLAKTLFDIMDWDKDLKYRFRGDFIEKDDQKVILFQLDEPEMVKTENIVLPPKDAESDNEAEITGRTVKQTIYILPPEWENTFGRQITSIAEVNLLEQRHYAADWDVLRPAKELAEYSALTSEDLEELLYEARTIIERWPIPDEHGTGKSTDDGTEESADAAAECGTDVGAGAEENGD